MLLGPSLKPHLLDGVKEDKVSDMDDPSKFDFERENAYYANILKEEQRKLPKFLSAFRYRGNVVLNIYKCVVSPSNQAPPYCQPIPHFGSGAFVFE